MESNQQPFTLESAQAEINRLREQVAKKNKQPAPPVFKIGLESGEIEIHRLDNNMISLPADTWEGLIKLAPKLIDFMLTNKHLIDRPDDSDLAKTMKFNLRRDVFANGSRASIIRPKRAESKKDAEISSNEALLKAGVAAAAQEG